jgi:hypothetical protein
MAASLEPLGLQDARLLHGGSGEFRLGLAYSRNLPNQFQEQGSHRRLTEIPALSLNLGLADRVEGQLQFSVLRLQEDGRNSDWDSGDLTIAFKVGLNRPRAEGTVAALRVATKLPNADNQDNFGTDETDFQTDILISRAMGPVEGHLNLGFAILGDSRPNQQGQADMLHYAVGLRLPLRPQSLHLLLSAEGLAVGSKLNRRGALRGGLQVALGSCLWDLGGSVGYLERSEDWSVRSGLTGRFDFPAW